MFIIMSKVNQSINFTILKNSLLYIFNKKSRTEAIQILYSSSHSRSVTTIIDIPLVYMLYTKIK